VVERPGRSGKDRTRIVPWWFLGNGHHASLESMTLGQCVTYGHIVGGAENYWHGEWLDLVRAISYGSGFRKCVYGRSNIIWIFCQLDQIT